MTQCTCPICDHESTYVRVYQHLQTGHRKSTLCRTLLEEQGDTTDSKLEPEAAEAPTADPSATDSEDGQPHRDPAIPR